MAKRTYLETIDYLFAKLPMFSRIGAVAYKKDLTNTLSLCAALDNPQHKIKTIHIAGTNGKGSTSHFLAAILQAAGYKTGLYTSPHLKDFRERIKINGSMIAEEFVINFTEQMEDLITTIEPSFFEITVAMAFDYFAKEKVDIAIIETGLGGRLDSTNVITPLLSIITNIGYDHQDMLGNTLPLIAMEKAGIIKENIPVIIGEVLAETEPVFVQKAKEMQSLLHFAFEKIFISTIETDIDSLKVKATSTLHKDVLDLELGLTGLYQIKNIKSVLLAIDLLVKDYQFTISRQAIENGLKNVKQLTGLHGRWEIIGKQPLIILDVAHNVDGIKQLKINIEELYNKEEWLEDLHLIIGMVKDKDVAAVLQLLPQNAIYYFTQANIPRALDKEVLQEKAAFFELKGAVYQNVNVALAAAKKAAKNTDCILVCGSVFLVGAVEI
jgi:dihydrofolate synthase / folylpolyglutamate synthase